MNAICKVCYRVGSEAGAGCKGCKGCKGLTRKSCENCTMGQRAPCASCYPDRNFRWTAQKTFETGAMLSRFSRNEFCGDCLSFLCDCGVSDYEEAIFEYLEARPEAFPGFTRPESIPESAESESPFDLKAWTRSQIAEYEWRASYFGPHPLRVELSHQTVIKGVSFCRYCWQPQVATFSGCYCTGHAVCSCLSDPKVTSETNPCATCWPTGALRHQLAMEFLAAS